MFAVAESQLLRQLLVQLQTQPAVLVQVAQTQGSVPREAGTWMAVFADGVLGTIGGGHLEYDAIAHARTLLLRGRDKNNCNSPETPPAETLRFALGPALGQCCGGVLHLTFERVTAQSAPALAERLAPALHPLALFGGGHVGHALVQALAALPFAMTWIDSRSGVFPAQVPAGVQCEHSEPVQAAVAGLAAGSRVLIMSFSHAEDLDVLAACLLRQRSRADLPFIGLIGSHTKWQTFQKRLAQRGFAPAELAQVTCPIGLPCITDKSPAVIAASVAAQLLLGLC